MDFTYKSDYHKGKKKMNGFMMAFTIMFMPFYFSVVVALIIKGIFLLKECWTMKPLLMIGGAIITLPPAITLFSHMLQKLEQTLL